MVKLNKWQKENLIKATNYAQAIIDKAEGKDSCCGVDKNSCKALSLYISTWIIPSITEVIKNKEK